MPTKKRTTKKAKTTKTKKETSIFKRPTTWAIAALVFALVFVSGLSLHALKSKVASNRLEAAELEVFSHLAESYIREMEYEYQEQPTMQQITGYGVSDEDGVLYITFDYAPYTVEDNNRIPGEVQHGIMYFWKDAEHNTYGHAFSHHDDASYHPAGTYIRLAE